MVVKSHVAHLFLAGACMNDMFGQIQLRRKDLPDTECLKDTIARVSW